MKTQVGEQQPLVSETALPGGNFNQAGIAVNWQPRTARCRKCNAQAHFSARQVAAAHRLWKLASGENGIAGVECLGGDGTTNHCRCGMEVEVVFTSNTHSEAHWRRPRVLASA